MNNEKDNAILRTESEESHTLRSFADAQEYIENTLSRISNFRNAQVEILPSYRLRRHIQSHSPHCVQRFELVSHRERGHAKAQFAFTLAEVLITLGVIGVVAAMTIPTLVSNYRKSQLETQIKAAYSTIQQAIRFAEYEDISYEMAIKDGDITSMQEWFDSFLAKHLKVEQICVDTPGCWHNVGIVKDLNGVSFPWDNPQGPGNGIITFKIAKGAWFSIDGFASGDLTNRFGIDTNNQGLVFIFDANGDKKPNRFGKDIYIMAWTDKGLVPAGKSKTTSEIDDNCLNGNGYWCLQKVISNGWKIPDKTWKR